LKLGRVAQRSYDFYKLLEESQYWPEEKMQAFQQERLGILLRHARDTVPFYRDRLNVIFGKNGSIDWDKWHELPILKRGDLHNSFDAMQSTNMPDNYGQIAQFSSSGSSGTPITISVNGRASLVSNATKYRGYSWHGIDWSKNMCGWMGDQAGPDILKGKSFGHWGPMWHHSTASGEHLEISRLVSDDQALDFIKRKNITYLTGRPKTMQQLALKAISRGDNIKFAGLLPFSTSIEDDVREDCRQAFGAELIERYSSKEAYAMAQQCPDHRHMHINAEILKLEILDENDMPCKRRKRYALQKTKTICLAK